MSVNLNFIELESEQHDSPLCAAVHDGLTSKPKTLPCRFFYDQAGSELFEKITELDEYYLTRCEASIFDRFATEIVSSNGGARTIVEFGSGSSAKTRKLLKAAAEFQDSVHYVPIDISAEFLRLSSHALIEEFPGISITAIAAEYRQAMRHIPDAEHRRLFLFLGSNIGNFELGEAIDFLREISSQMNPEDSLLLGVDLVKDRDVLHHAYNDSDGVTAEFNLNLLRRINRDLGANFSVCDFEHSAPFDESHSRIEMRLTSLKQQTVFIEALETEYAFEEGESIFTEWSHKYTENSLSEIAVLANLEAEKSWTDESNWFAEYLLKPKMAVRA